MIAGFGGQGVMAIGKTLAEAGMKEGKDVSWLPSYGPEMRGGTANCAVVLSDDPIVCPIVLEPTELIAMNAPSIAKFGPKVRSGGAVFINSSVVKETFDRPDISTYYIPCDEIAYELGNPKVANMVMLGAYIGATKSRRKETVETMLHEMFTGPKAKLIPLNLTALQKGMELVQ
jgi:2-oxoglutarate ferredoxin oxidoreductase subunit gamma